MATLQLNDGVLLVQQRGTATRWRLEDILWVEAQGHQTKLHLRNSSHLVPVGLAALVHWLPRSQFQRLNRSLVVNRLHVKSVAPGRRGKRRWQLSNGLTLTGSG